MIAPTFAAHDAERLLARLGPMLDAPATIAWEPGLVAGERQAYGYVSPSDPAVLHIDPDGRDLVDTVMHEWIHSLELRGVIETYPIRVAGTDCTKLARRLAPRLAALAARQNVDLGQPAEELLLLFFRHTGQLPTALRRTRGSSR